MNIPSKSFINGISLPVYGLGTWQMGGRWEADNSNDEDMKDLTDNFPGQYFSSERVPLDYEADIEV